MFKFDYIAKEDIKEHNSNWSEIPDHPCRILIFGGSGSAKNLKDPYEPKYQLLINKRESTSLNYVFDSKAFIKYANDMHDIYKNIEKCTRLNSTHYFFMKILNKRKLQRISLIIHETSTFKTLWIFRNSVL